MHCVSYVYFLPPCSRLGNDKITRKSSKKEFSPRPVFFLYKDHNQERDFFLSVWELKGFLETFELTKCLDDRTREISVALRDTVDHGAIPIPIPIILVTCMRIMRKYIQSTTCTTRSQEFS